MKDPWLTGEIDNWSGCALRLCDAVSRLDQVKRMTADQLHDAIAWPDTQRTVRLAAERRLRTLSNQHVYALVRRRRCQAAASILHGVIVHHDKGLYPAYCILEEGHEGPHKNRKSWWPNDGLERQEPRT